MPREYTEEQVKFVTGLVSRKKKPLKITPAVRKMCEHFGLSYDDVVRRSFSARLQNLGITKNIKLIEDAEDFKKATKKTFDKRRNTFIFTWAQNETPVHSNFFDNLIAYSKHKKAGLHVIAGRYRNPTSVFTDQDRDTWTKEVLPFLDANRHSIHKYLQVLSDVKISPTASMPLSGFNSFTGLESCIIGHPRMHLASLPVLPNYPNKLLLSTGACTVENYTDSKSGKKGEFHHSLGCVIVELDGDHYHIRQITADSNGNFYDLFSRVKDGNVEKNTKGCEVAVLGDLHIRQVDKKAEESSFKLLDVMKPKYTVIHDIFDGQSISHHTKNYPFQLLELEESGSDNVEEEIKEMFAWVNKRKKYNLVIPAANHNDWLDQWLDKNDWRKERNKKAYLKYANVKAEGLAKKGLVAYLIDKEFEDVITLDYNGSFRVLGWELALHYDKGANGSRGSATQFKNLNTKSVGGHGHSAFRYDGSFAVGTLTLMDMGYNKGLSSWTKTNVLIYPDGKAQHVHFINGKFYR
jgi:hypothetical protein